MLVLKPASMEQPGTEIHDIEPPDTTAVRASFEAALAASGAPPLRIISFSCAPYILASSFPLLEIAVEWEDGRKQNIIGKNVGRAALSPAATRAKPALLLDPRREIETYRYLLAPAQLGTARFFGAAEGVDGSLWLFLEKVAGRELYQIGDFAVWQSVARALAKMHASFAAPQEQATQVPLVVYDAAFYRRWLTRARRFHPQHLELALLAPNYKRAIKHLAALPRTVIHGEFYASNILVNESCEPTRICPIDWETTALAPGLMDVAALVAGSWSEAQKEALALAYYDELPEPKETSQAFLTSLRFCRLHLAVQWLGWSNRWTPPENHAHDWLAEVRHLTEILDLL